MAPQIEIMPRPVAAPRPQTPLMMLVTNFFLGGTEGQAVALWSQLPAHWDASLGCVRREGPHLETVRARGCEPLELPLQGSVMRANTVRQIARLARTLRARRVALVHAHDFYTALLAVPAARMAGAKVVVGRLDLGHWPRGLARAALVAATRQADGVIANAQAIARALVAAEHLPPHKVRVIPNGIDLARFDARARAPLADALPARPGVKPLVHLANFNPVKAHEDLFEAVRILKFERPELDVWLVGDGPGRAHLEALALRMGIGARIHFLGHRQDVPAILKRAYLGVLCSHAEGMSNALIEYLAAGLPAVATDVGGNGELVVDGERGLLVPPRSPQALARALARMLGAPAWAAERGAAGRRYVARELTLERLAQRHDRFYRQVLDEP